MNKQKKQLTKKEKAVIIAAAKKIAKEYHETIKKLART